MLLVDFDLMNFSDDTTGMGMEDQFGFVAGPSTSDKKAWVFDFDAINNIIITQVIDPSPHTGTITVGGGREPQITEIVNVNINGSHGLITLQNIFLIPKLGRNTNLMSWSCIAKNGFATTGMENGLTIYKLPVKSNLKEIIRIANANSTALYIFKTKGPYIYLSTATSFYDCHQGHKYLPASSLSGLRNMPADTRLPPTTAQMEICNTCELAKSLKTHLAPLTEPQSIHPLELIYSYLSGWFLTPSLGFFSYCITFLDSYSRYAKPCFLKKKSSAVPARQRYIEYIENQLPVDKIVKLFRSDNGGK